jgi:mRNA interferase RelE/StbE
LTWRVEWDTRAVEELKSLDKYLQKKIFAYMRDRTIINPRNFGKSLSHDKVGLWRYRVEDYRIICQIKDFCLVVLVVAASHRKKLY